jgi:hypothetical protein
MKLSQQYSRPTKAKRRHDVAMVVSQRSHDYNYFNKEVYAPNIYIYIYLSRSTKLMTQRE